MNNALIDANTNSLTNKRKVNVDVVQLKVAKLKIALIKTFMCQEQTYQNAKLMLVVLSKQIKLYHLSFLQPKLIFPRMIKCMCYKFQDSRQVKAVKLLDAPRSHGTLQAVQILGMMQKCLK